MRQGKPACSWVAQQELDKLKFDVGTTQMFLQLIASQDYPEQLRLLALIHLKNKVKQHFGVSI